VFESEDLLLEKESKEKPILFDRKSKESSDKSNNSKKKFNLLSLIET
jgi:hypothetical protein